MRNVNNERSSEHGIVAVEAPGFPIKVAIKCHTYTTLVEGRNEHNYKFLNKTITSIWNTQCFYFYEGYVNMA